LKKLTLAKPGFIEGFESLRETNASGDCWTKLHGIIATGMSHQKCSKSEGRGSRNGQSTSPTQLVED